MGSLAALVAIFEICDGQFRFQLVKLTLLVKLESIPQLLLEVKFFETFSFPVGLIISSSEVLEVFLNYY